MDAFEQSKRYFKDGKYLEKINWPDALIKATTDEFYYALKTKNGETFVFKFAEYVNDNFVRLIFPKKDEWMTPHTLPTSFPFDRGVELNVSDISWVADAPYGS